MPDLKKHFIKLMEDVDMNYQAPSVKPNSGDGLTKFAPTPATKVLKSYNVSGDFLRKSLSHGGGVTPQAVDQIMGGIDGQQVDGPLGGEHFDAVLGSFGVDGNPGAGMPGMDLPSGGAGGVAIDVAPPIGSSGDALGAGGVPPAGAEAPVIEPNNELPPASDMSAGQVAVPGANTASPEEIPVDAGAGVGFGGVGTGDDVDSHAPEGVEPADGIDDSEEDKEIQPVA